MVQIVTMRRTVFQQSECIQAGEVERKNGAKRSEYAKYNGGYEISSFLRRSAVLVCARTSRRVNNGSSVAA